MKNEQDKKPMANLSELSEDSLEKVCTGEATGPLPAPSRGPGFGPTPTLGTGAKPADSPETHSKDELPKDKSAVIAERAKKLRDARSSDEREAMQREFAQQDAEEERAALESARDADRDATAARRSSGKTFWKGPGKLNHSGVEYSEGDDVSSLGDEVLSKLPADQLDRS